MAEKIALEECPGFEHQEELPPVEIGSPFDRPLISEVTHLRDRELTQGYGAMYDAAGVLYDVEGYADPASPMRLRWLERGRVYHSQIRTALLDEYRRQNRSLPDYWQDETPLQVALHAAKNNTERFAIGADYYAADTMIGILVYFMGNAQKLLSSAQPAAFTNAIVASIGERVYSAYPPAKEGQDLEVSLSLGELPSINAEVGYTALAGFDIRAYMG